MTALAVSLFVAAWGWLAPAPPSDATPVSRVELAAALEQGHVEVFGAEPSEPRLAVAWAHSAIEVGQGARARGNNLGNIGASSAGPAYVVAGVRFRVYPTLDEGARAYWRHVLERCPGALPWFDAGDATGAARALRRCGWYRAPVETYAAAMRSLRWTYEREVKRWL